MSTEVEAAELFHGHEPRECGEHRTVGSHRAWCHDCGMWCYPRLDGACYGCGVPALTAALAATEARAGEAERQVEILTGELQTVEAVLAETEGRAVEAQQRADELEQAIRTALTVLPNHEQPDDGGRCLDCQAANCLIARGRIPLRAALAGLDNSTAATKDVAAEIASFGTSGWLPVGAAPVAGLDTKDTPTGKMPRDVKVQFACACCPDCEGTAEHTEPSPYMDDYCGDCTAYRCDAFGHHRPVAVVSQPPETCEHGETEQHELAHGIRDGMGVAPEIRCPGPVTSKETHTND